MKFEIAYLKLTLFYVLIVMVISIGFSVAIYNISSNELGRGLGRFRDLYKNQNISRQMMEFDSIQDEQIKVSNDRLKVNLFYFNLLILILSAITSYFLAKRTLEPIEKAMEAQNRFTGDASHELRTPLSAMRSEVEVALRDKNLTLSDAKKILNSNLEEINKLEKISNALLRLARTDDDTTKINELVKLDEIVMVASKKAEKRAENKKIKFINKLIHIEINGDKDNLEELFAILYDNAIKYSPENTKIHTILKKEKGQISVIIKDQGIGIRASDLPHIFDRFYRADQSRAKESIEGFGLGLSIAQQIVKIHNGDIKVESKIGKGTTFIISF